MLKFLKKLKSQYIFLIALKLYFKILILLNFFLEIFSPMGNLKTKPEKPFKIDLKLFFYLNTLKD